MLRVFVVFVLLTSVAGICFADDSMKIPRPVDAVRYERQYPVFLSKQISRVQGDALLTALDSGSVLVPVRPPPGALCALYLPPAVSLVVERTNGKKYVIGLSANGDFLRLPGGNYVVKEAARPQIAKVMAQIAEDFKQEILRAPRPFTYTISTLDDGGTLYGIARLFYGNARKWKQIYAANTANIKNPDVIFRGMELTIPKVN